MTAFNPQNVAAEIGGTIAVGGAVLGVMRLWVRGIIQNTNQLQHNGGSHVADYAKDARDSSFRTEAALTQHLIDSAAAKAEHGAKIDLLMQKVFS